MTISARQMTTMKYGLRMEKRDTLSSVLLLVFLALVLHQLDHLGLHFFARLQAAAIADDHHFALLQAGKHLRIGGGLNAQVPLGGFRSCSDESTMSTVVWPFS